MPRSSPPPPLHSGDVHARGTAILSEEVGGGGTRHQRPPGSGARAWGVERSMPQLHPTFVKAVKGVPRPSDMRADGSSGPVTRVGWGWGRGQLIFQQARGSCFWLCCPAPLPPDPPPLLHHPAHDLRTSLLKRTSANLVQDDAAGGRVWVPTIPVGWDGGGC